MYVAFVLVALALGTVLFHYLSPWWWTSIASNWTAIDDTMNIMFAITGVVCIAVILFMALCIFRFHHTEGRRATYDPENKRLELLLIIITGVGVAAMLTPGLIVWDRFITVPKDAMTIEVLGQQWQWTYRLPGADKRLGATDIRFVKPDNPMGLDPKDPSSLDDLIVTDDDLHLLVDKPVRILLRSLDVVHDFYVPEFRAKMDLMPGMITYLWLTPTKIDVFDILCAGFCGIGHPQMRGRIIVDSAEDYASWLASLKTFAQLHSVSANNAVGRSGQR